MAFTDLSAQAQEGLAYAATILVDSTTNQPYPNARAVMDAIAEREGCAFYEQKLQARRARRLAKLESPAGATLAAQVDALPD